MQPIKLVVALIILSAGLSTADEFDQYLGHNVSINACNQTVYQGQVIELWENSIVLRELCNPELGNVTIRKNCIVYISEGFECIN